MRFQSGFIAVFVLAAAIVIAEDNLNESKAIEKIELLAQAENQFAETGE